MKYDIRSTATAITGEAHTITDGIIKLSETASDIVISGFTEVTGTPSAGQFKPLYFTDTYGREVAGILQFNSSDNSTAITVAYNGYGSIIWADDFNTMESNISTVKLKSAENQESIKDLQSTIQSINVNNEATQDATGYGFIDLPKNCASGQVSVTAKGNTATNIVPTTASGWESGTIAFATGALVGDATRVRSAGLLPIMPSTQYTIKHNNMLGKTTQIAVCLYNSSGVFIETVTNSWFTTNPATFTTPATAYSYKIALKNLDGSNVAVTDIPTILPNIQTGSSIISMISTGTKSTSNVRLTSEDSSDNIVSQLYLPAIGQSLPNGVKDEVSVVGGTATKTQRNSKKILASGDITGLTVSGVNVDAVKIPLANLVGIKPQQTAALDGNIVVDGFSPEVNLSTWDLSTSVNKWGTNDVDLFLFVPKNTYADVAAARTDLVTTKATSVTYQLATPIISEVDVSGMLLGYPSGTVYVEPAIADAGIYDNGISILNTSYPIKTLEKIFKVDYETGVETELAVSGATIASGGLSFTHTGLADGDIVFFTYFYDETATTLPESTITYYDSRVVVQDSVVTTKYYKIGFAVANGVVSLTATEV